MIFVFVFAMALVTSELRESLSLVLNIILHVYDNKNASRDILLMNTKITWTEGKVIKFFPL